MSETTLFPELPVPGRPAEPVVWPIVLAGAYPDGAWTCAWCAAEMTGPGITHKQDCRWVTDFTGRCRAGALRELAADLRATAKHPDFRSRVKGLEFAATIAEREAGKS